jgi:hypothetical protein
MQGWIAECKASHTLCSDPSTTSDSGVPSRLLDVSSAQPKLVDTASLPSQTGVGYAALSHMWGDIDAPAPLRTLLSNIEEMKKGIEVERLPRNFLDAVRVCRRLRLDYVWIDSLCIIQDSKEDWSAEAENMHRYYRDAEVTIVAYVFPPVMTEINAEWTPGRLPRLPTMASY